MNLSDMETLLALIVNDSSLAAYFTDWINDAILELASDFEFPTLKLLNPVSFSVDSSSWTWPMPADFHKKLFRCAFIDTDGKQKKVHVYDRRQDLEYRDHTQTGERVDAVATAKQGKDDFLLIYPLPLAQVSLMNWYYRKPAVLVGPTDTCDCIPPEYHERVIIPRVVVRNYELLQDQVAALDLKSIDYWKAREMRGLYGAPGESIGLINYFEKTTKGPPRRRGGRDPVGWSPFRYGH